MQETRNILRVASIYMATIIGAGFASGQEIVQFFSDYDRKGFLGVLLTGVLFSVLGAVVLERVYSDRIRSYEEFVYPLFGRTIGRLVEISATLFMLCLFCIMIAGAGNIISEKFSFSYPLSVLLMSILCMFLIFTSIRGVAVLSTVITPILVVGILIAGVYIITCRELPAFNAFEFIDRATHNWLVSSILYAGYNSIMSVMVMTGLLPYLKSKRVARLGGILGGTLLCGVVLVLNIAIGLNYAGASTSEMPVLSILSDYSGLMGLLYSVLLWLAMLLSSVTSGYCFVERLGSRTRKNRFIIAALVCAAAVPLSAIGFSRLISLIYPFFGYVGLFIMAGVLFQGLGAVLGRKHKMIRNR